MPDPIIENGVIILRASSSANIKKLASAIYAVFTSKEYHQGVQLRALGASAVNQAFKSVIIARRDLAPLGYDLKIRPFFLTENNEHGEEKSIACMELIPK